MQMGGLREAEQKVQFICHLPQPPQEFTENHARKRKYQVRRSCVLISGVRLVGDRWLQTWRVGSLLGCMLSFLHPKKWFEAFSMLAERQSNLFFSVLPLFGCNVTSVQFGMKRIRDSTPVRCSHKPEESTVLFCFAPLPPYSC